MFQIIHKGVRCEFEYDDSKTEYSCCASMGVYFQKRSGCLHTLSILSGVWGDVWCLSCSLESPSCTNMYICEGFMHEKLIKSWTVMQTKVCAVVQSMSFCLAGNLSE